MSASQANPYSVRVLESIERDCSDVLQGIQDDVEIKISAVADEMADFKTKTQSVILNLIERVKTLEQALGCN